MLQRLGKKFFKETAKGLYDSSDDDYEQAGMLSMKTDQKNVDMYKKSDNSQKHVISMNTVPQATKTGIQIL